MSKDNIAIIYFMLHYNHMLNTFISLKHCYNSVLIFKLDLQNPEKVIMLML